MRDHAAATAFRHSPAASALKIRSVDRATRCARPAAECVTAPSARRAVMRLQSSRRLEREAGRNVECMWLTGKLAPDFKTIADFRRDNGEAIRAVWRQFVLLCREIGLQ